MKDQTTNQKTAQLQDPALDSPGQNFELTLTDVGMERVQTQVLFGGLRLPAVAHAGVSLTDPKARGIHMSRLFRILNHLHLEELTWSWLVRNMKQMLATHETLSDSAHLQVEFDLPVLRQALKSQEHGWRNYPLKYKVASIKGHLHEQLTLRVLYSSTCPCSAGLSRQAMQEDFQAAFLNRADLSTKEVYQWLGQPRAVSALPHAQRSEALVTLSFNATAPRPTPLAMLDLIEQALGTPVQAAVKREDEQEFARLNAQNLMFCEDAARKLKAALQLRADLVDFAIEVRHFESLHAHDVVARAQKDHT